MDTSPAPMAPGVLADTELTAAHDLKILVLSRHPAIALETGEEERADAVLAEVARETNLAVFEWTITHGLVRRPGTEPIYGTQDPLRMLGTIPDLSVEGVFVLKDFSSHLSTPALSRTFRELLEQLAAPERLSTIVLLGLGVDLPPEIATDVVRYQLCLPGRDEYRRVIDQVVTLLQANGRAEINLQPDDTDAFAFAFAFAL